MSASFAGGRKNAEDIVAEWMETEHESCEGLGNKEHGGSDEGTEGFHCRENRSIIMA